MKTLSRAVATALGILLLLPVAGRVWDPVRTSEMMGGRMMVAGFIWLLGVALAVAILLAIGATAVWRRLRP